MTLSLLDNLPTPRITAHARFVRSPIGISKVPLPRQSLELSNRDYMRVYKEKYPDKYAIRQRRGIIKRNIRRAIDCDDKIREQHWNNELAKLPKSKWGGAR